MQVELLQEILMEVRQSRTGQLRMEEKVENRLGGTETGFGSMSQKLDSMIQWLDQVDDALDTIRVRFQDMDAKLEAVGSRMNSLDFMCVSLSEKLTAHDKVNNEEFRKIGRQLDSITEVVARTMEDIVELKNINSRKGAGYI
ncbi:MAG: hypothetical protein HGA22_06280 [Clostridiales bacterium]|nr:hypothetical protein [Clostridiales bacterium]